MPPEERRERLAHVVVRRLPSSEYSAEVEGQDDIRVRARDPVDALDGVRKMLEVPEDHASGELAQGQKPESGRRDDNKDKKGRGRRTR